MTPKPTTILALVLALCMTAAAQQLSVENPPSVLLDEEFTANVTASGCNITGIEFTLSFDGSILKALNVTQGDFFSGATMTVPSDLSGAINEGRVGMGIALKEGQACGNGTLAEVRFEGTSAGESDLRLENVTITDEEILPVVNFSLVNSSVSVSSPTLPACNVASDCGTDGYVDQFCQDHDVYGYYRTYSCNNPGTVDASCTYSDSTQLAEDCGESFCSYGGNYCSGNQVVRDLLCYIRSCDVITVACFIEIGADTTETVGICAEGYECLIGECVSSGTTTTSTTTTVANITTSTITTTTINGTSTTTTSTSTTSTSTTTPSTSTTSTTTSSTSTSTTISPTLTENITVNLTANETVEVEVPGAGTEIEIEANESAEGEITVDVYNETPTGVELPNVVGSYIRIEVTVQIQGSIKTVTIRKYYSDEEIRAAGLDEELIYFYRYSTHLNAWEKLDSYVNVAGNYVETTSSHFSYYALGGEPDTSPPEILDTNPEGTIKDTTPTLEVATDEQAECRYDSEDRNFSEMGHEFSTDDGVLHEDTISLSPGYYVYYVRCNDSLGNANNVSATIEFEIIAPSGGDFDFSNRPAREAETICKPDGKKNYRETGVDCGGPCGKCPETTTVTTSIKTTVPTTSVTTSVTTSIATTTVITTTTLPAPGIIGSVIALSRDWADELSIAAVLLLLSATGYVMKKGKGKRKGQCSLSML